MNPDFKDMLSALSEEGVEYLLVGAYALAVHGVPRATGDLDIWVNPTPENAQKVYRALARFGAPLKDLAPEDFSSEEVAFAIGIPPRRIDIVTSLSGLTFPPAWGNRHLSQVAGLEINVIGREDFVANKKASGRPKDLADIALLEEAEG